MAEREPVRDPIGKAIAVYRTMCESPEKAWSITELATATGLVASTAYRAVSALLTQGLVEQDETTLRYGIGVEAQRLARRVSASRSLAQVAEPYLEKLSADLKATSLLGVYDRQNGKRMTFALQLHGPDPLRYVVPLNEWLPLHRGATGLAILAHIDPRVSEQILDEVSKTEGISVRDLRRQLIEVRKKGYAITHGHRIHGAVGVASAIFDAQSEVVGDVAVTVHESRYNPANEQSLVCGVKNCAKEISDVLGASNLPQPE